MRQDLASRLKDTWAGFPELEDCNDQLASTLSGSHQKMVPLANALKCRPRSLMIDEMLLVLAPFVVTRLLGFVAAPTDRRAGILRFE